MKTDIGRIHLPMAGIIIIIVAAAALAGCLVYLLVIRKKKGSKPGPNRGYPPQPGFRPPNGAGGWNNGFGQGPNPGQQNPAGPWQGQPGMNSGWQSPGFQPNGGYQPFPNQPQASQGNVWQDPNQSWQNPGYQQPDGGYQSGLNQAQPNAEDVWHTPNQPQASQGNVWQDPNQPQASQDNAWPNQNQNWQTPNQPQASQDNMWQDPNQGWQNPNQPQASQGNMWQAPNQSWQAPNQPQAAPDNAWPDPNQSWQNAGYQQPDGGYQSGLNQAQPNAEDVWQTPNQPQANPDNAWPDPNQNWQTPNQPQANMDNAWPDPNQNWQTPESRPQETRVSQDTRAYDPMGSNWQNQSTDSQSGLGNETSEGVPYDSEPGQASPENGEQELSPRTQSLIDRLGAGGDLQDDVTVQMFTQKPAPVPKPTPAGAVHMAEIPAERWEIFPGGWITVGRRPIGCDAVISGDPMISGSHCRIRAVDFGQLEVEDLSSTNGTYVNGRRITGTVPVRSGDLIRLGATDLVVE